VKKSLLAAVVILVIVTLACGESTPEAEVPVQEVTATEAPAEAEDELAEQPTEVEEPTEAPGPTDTPAPTDTPEPELLYLGDVVEQHGCLLSAVTVEDPASPGMFYEAEEGKRLIAVEVIVGNASSDESIDVNPLSAVLLDSEGFTYEPELAGRDGQIPTLDLNLGEKAKGWIAFVIPNEAVPAKLKYALGLFSDKVLQVSLESPPEGHVPNDDGLSVLPPELAVKLGDTAEQHGCSLSATAVEDPSTPGMFYEPVDGYKLVAVEIVIGNVSIDEALSVNPLSTVLVDDRGFVYDVELGARDEQIATLDLGKGEKVKGWVAFTIPENAVPASIKFVVNMFSDEIVQVGLTE
jgi:hypothetical protein